VHISFEKLLDFVDDRLDPNEREALSAHLVSCSDCANERERLGHLIELMKTDNGDDAPAHLLAKVKDLLHQKTPSQLLKRIVAALAFDSHVQTPEYAVRSMQSQSRQLLFSAGEIEVDLRVATLEDRVQIKGQLLGAVADHGTVALEGQSEWQAAALNELQEFTLAAVPSGQYTLRLCLVDREIEIPDLRL
jgi:anti-sigma factor RsiW